MFISKISHWDLSWDDRQAPIFESDRQVWVPARLGRIQLFADVLKK